MEQWKKLSQPPKWALKEIAAGRLKGKSDINPQWRYMAMTEVFGVVGIGWKYNIDKTWTEQGADGEVLCFVQVSVYIRNKDDGSWSDPISGLGGSTLIAKEKNGMYNNDEAYKMAVTDALSTALKMLGVAADVYMGLWDGSKYRIVEETKPETKTEKTESEKRQVAIEMYSKLVERAKVVHLTIPALDAGLSSLKMKAQYQEQYKFVQQAEAQAKAGE